MMPRRTNRPLWTPEEEAKLRELWKENVRGKALAEAMGRTKSAVATRANLLGLNRLRP